MSSSLRPQALLLHWLVKWRSSSLSALRLWWSSKIYITQVKCAYKNNTARTFGLDDGVVSAHSPSSGDSQWAAAGACDAMFWLVGRGGAGRPGLVEWMGEVLFRRILFIPNNHLRRGGGAFSPEDRKKTFTFTEEDKCSTDSSWSNFTEWPMLASIITLTDQKKWIKLNYLTERSLHWSKFVKFWS